MRINDRHLPSDVHISSAAVCISLDRLGTCSPPPPHPFKYSITQGPKSAFIMRVPLQSTMTYTTFTALLIASAIGLALAASSAEPGFGQVAYTSHDSSTQEYGEDRFASLITHAKPPLKQYDAGVAYEEIVCKPDRTLMWKPDANTACVYTTSVPNLEQRGWSTVSVSTDWCIILGFCGTSEHTDMTDSHNTMNSSPQRRVSEVSGIPEQGYHLGYPWVPPTLFVDYPTAFKINQTETIYLNYTFMWQNPATGKYEKQKGPNIGDYHDIHYFLTMPDGIEIVSEGYNLHDKLFSSGYPERYYIYKYVKSYYNVSTTEWHTDSIKIKFTQPMTQPRDFFHITVDLSTDHNWLMTVGDTVTLLDEEPVQFFGADDYSSHRADDPRHSIGIEVPEDPDNPIYPLIPEYGDFLKNTYKPTT